MAQSMASQRRLWPDGGIDLVIITPTNQLVKVNALYETPCFYWFDRGRFDKRSKGYTVLVVPRDK